LRRDLHPRVRPLGPSGVRRPRLGREIARPRGISRHNSASWGVLVFEHQVLGGSRNMEAFENRLPPWLRPEHDALVARLRELEWTEVKPELRQRCWDQFRDRLTGGAEAPRSIARTGDRYSFTRREQ